MRKTPLVVLLAALSLSGCDLFKNDGKLDLQITDAPYTDASQVFVTVSRVRLQQQDGHHQSFDLSPAMKIDLLQLSNGNVAKLLDGEALPSGDYDSIRLTLDDGNGSNYVQRFDGGLYGLDVPDNQLQLDTDFSIDDRGTTTLTLDVDLRRSLRAPENSGDDYHLVPNLRLINDDDAGTISGTIPSAQLGNGCVAAVYLYRGKVTPDDIGGNGAQPYSSANVLADGSGGYRYTAAFLPEGTYTLALTCDADQDDPADNDDPDFSDPEHADVKAGHTVTQNF